MPAERAAVANNHRRHATLASDQWRSSAGLRQFDCRIATGGEIAWAGAESGASAYPTLDPVQAGSLSLNGSIARVPLGPQRCRCPLGGRQRIAGAVSMFFAAPETSTCGLLRHGELVACFSAEITRGFSVSSGMQSTAILTEISRHPAATHFVLRPIPAAFADRVRATQRDDFCRTVAVTISRGGEPVRDRLRRVPAGERLILCGYQAVPLPSDFAEIGPVYISAERPVVSAWADELLPGYFNRTFAVRAYDTRDAIVGSRLVEPAAAPEKFREFLARPEVAYLHARFAGHGCYAARIDRA